MKAYLTDYIGSTIIENMELIGFNKVNGPTPYCFQHRHYKEWRYTFGDESEVLNFLKGYYFCAEQTKTGEPK